MSQKKQTLIVAALLAATITLCDQLSKAWAESAYNDGHRQIIGSLVELVAVANRGIAFGQLSGYGIVIATLVALALAALIYYFLRHLDKPLIWLPVGLIIGGAAGNIIDRIDLGYVYDFIAVGAWPAFNLADSAIVVGVILLFIIVEIVGGKRAGSK